MPVSGRHPFRALSLRRMVSIGSVVLVALSLVAAVEVLVVAVQNRDTAAELRNVDASISVLHEIDSALFSVTRIQFLRRLDARDDEETRQAVERLRASLRAVASHIQTADEAAAYAELHRRVEQLLAEPQVPMTPLEDYLDSSARLDRARDQVAVLLEINRDQAVAAITRSSRTQRLAMVGAAISAVLLPLMVLGLVFTARRLLYRPFQDLERTIERYAAGDLQARVTSEGPVEIRAIADRFAMMADTLASQREMQATLLAGVAHDLRNPLTALSTAAQLAERDLERAPERVVERLAGMRRQLSRLERMVGDLLDVNRLAVGEVALLAERGDLREVVRESVHLFRNVSPAHSIELDLPHDPIAALFDPLRIGQVLNNLLSNAIKYSPQGGVVAVSLRTDGHLATIAVQDHGIGISAADQARIFQPFQRSDSVVSTIPGVGLGLAMTKRLVEAHGGTIRVESTEGEGSTFTVELPLEG